MLALTRQNLPQLRQGFDERNRCAAGAYELIAADDDAAVVSLFATGSEVAIAVEAQETPRRAQDLGAGGLGAVLRAVAGAAGRPSARPSSATRRVNVAVEAGIRQGWDAIIGSDGSFRRHDRVRRQRARPRSFTSISALRPKRSPKRHWLG